MIRLVSIIGTRPEAIKMAPVINAFKADPRFSCRVCITAQHREMLDQVLSVFNIVPDTDLNLMRRNQTLGQLSARVIRALDDYLIREKPDLIVIQGDTTTVFCAALSAFYHRIPVAHIEAGLRTRDFETPWPEEANRVLTSRLVNLHLAPTQKSRENLLKEGVPQEHIIVTGNTVVDSLLLALQKIKTSPPTIPGLSAETFASWNGKRMILITGHRRESFGNGLENICRAIVELAQRFPDVHFIYPAHSNPNVRKPVQKILGGAKTANITLLHPLPYLPFVFLMSCATIIMTDSGGIQEEAPSLGKPVLVMREKTERPEGVDAGFVKLVGTNPEKIVVETTLLMTSQTAYQSMVAASNPYGDGKAAGRIVKACYSFMMGSYRKNSTEGS